MTKRAVSQGTLRRDPYGKLHPELPERKSRHLKLEDLKKLMETPIDKPNLQKVRDWFLFSTFTGLSYSDLTRLSDKDITQAADGTWWLHIRRKKQIPPRQSGCWRFRCGSSRNTGLNVRATRFSTFTAGSILSYLRENWDKHTVSI